MKTTRRDFLASDPREPDDDATRLRSVRPDRLAAVKRRQDDGDAGEAAAPESDSPETAGPLFDDDAQGVPHPHRAVATGETAESTPATGMIGPEGHIAAFREFEPTLLERLVVSDRCPPMLAEQFRHLAASLLHDTQLKSIMVTSPSVGDGKSLTATNLALTLSRSYRRHVLLIDADLRRPSLHRLFRVPNVNGLSEGLRATADQRLGVIRITDTLTLLPGGRPQPDPVGLLSSARMARIIKEAAGRFDSVILDTPPAGVLADATILLKVVDGALVVVRAGTTPFPELDAAVATLGTDRVLGIVLNAVDPRKIHRRSYYDHYYGHESRKRDDEE